MPLLKHAKKKQRQDKVRTLANKKMSKLYKSLLKAARSKPTVDSVGKAFSAVDKAAKQNIIHKNKAARLKSQLSKVASGKTVAQVKTKTAKAKARTTKEVKAKAISKKSPATTSKNTK